MSVRLSHLAAVLALAALATAVGGAWATYRVAGDEFRGVLDDDLENQGRMLSRLLAAESVRLEPAELQSLLRKAFRRDDEDTVWVTVYDLSTGRQASNLEHRIALGQAMTGAVTINHAGHVWTGYQRRDGGRVVQLLRRDDLYRDIEEDILEDVIAPVFIASVVTLLLIALLLAVVLRPLSRLVRELEARTPNTLQPVALGTPVREVQMLGDTINRLMAGVDEVLRRERQFASDVAHELRTPLSTLKLELASTDPDLAAVKAEVDRVARLVQQLLTLARLEQGRWRDTLAPVRLDALFAEALDRLEPGLQGQQVRLVRALEPVSVHGDPTLLRTLLQNLLANVVRHCPAGTSVTVSLRMHDGRALLEVEDDGPGIPLDLRERMNRGLTRLDSRSEGLGLGLSICHRIAGVHGATLSFLPRADGSPGLRVSVRFAGLS